MFLNACTNFFETMESVHAQEMTLSTYERIRHNLHKRSPEKYSDLSNEERFAIISQAQHFDKLGLYYLRNKFGKIERLYYVK